MKTISLRLMLIIGLITMLGCGCTSTFKDYGYQRPFKFQDPKMSKYDFLANRTSTNFFRLNYDDYVKAGELVKAKTERNAILSELIFMIDGAHGEFERNSRAVKSTADLFADLAVLGVSGAAAVSGGAETKAILSAVAGGITGAKLAVNKDILQEQAIEAIQAEMGATMKQRKAQMITCMTNTVDKYPLDLGLSDVANYYYDGTFTRALQNLVQDAKTKESSANKNIEQAINSTSSSN